MKIRFAEMKDLERIVEIYNQAILTKRCTGDLDVLTVNDRLKWFEDHVPNKYPIYIAEIDNEVAGWCSISPYRAGRRAFDGIAEISYYIDFDFHGKGIASKLIEHALNDCERLEVKHLYTMILEVNEKSRYLMEKYNFEKWGFLPDIVNLDGLICGHCIYGRRV